MYSPLEKPLLKKNISAQLQKVQDDSTSSEEWGSSCSSESSLSDEERYIYTKSILRTV